MFIFGYLFIAIAKILSILINVYILVIIVEAVLSWFSAAITQNEITRLISNLVEPILSVIRKHLPRFSVDLSPLVAILALYFTDQFIVNIIRELGERML